MPADEVAKATVAASIAATATATASPAAASSAASVPPAAPSTPALPAASAAPAGARRREAPAFSLFFFSDDGSSQDDDKYGLVLAAARWADTNGFHAIWTPERHFHAFGGLYPSPATLSAAIAATTQRLGIRAGSVVAPLHHAVRVAEEWALVDNLSGGRVGVSFASGWVPDDFVLSATAYASRREATFASVDMVRRLWRGETLDLPVPGRPEAVAIRTFPRPIQPELPTWITTGGSVDTCEVAGRLGLNLLTGLLRGTLATVAENIAVYRQARSEAGHDPDAGRVTLMLHTFVGEHEDAVRDTVHEPLLAYLRGHLDMYRERGVADGVLALDTARISQRDERELAELAFERYFTNSGLFGTPERCLEQVERIRAAGVDEVACLVDFGVDRTTVLSGLERLAELRDRALDV